MRFLTKAVLSFLLAGCIATGNDRRFHETDVSPPQQWQWKWAGKAKADEPIEVIIAVKQNNKDLLEQLVLTVSDPDSKAYGQHLSLDAVNELVSPALESVASIEAHLLYHGVTDCEATANNDFIKCFMSVSTAEAVLGAQYHYYQHHEANVTVVRTPYYSLPTDVSRHVDFVSPTVRFPTLQKRVAANSNGSSTRENTPSSLRSLYHIGDVEGTNGKQSCTAFLEQYYLPSDLDLFWSKYYPKASGREIKVLGPNKGPAGVEAELDIEFITTVGGGVPTEFWSFPGRAPHNPENEPFLKFMYQVGNTSDADIPKVFSTSYGEAEHTVSSAYMQRINVEFQKAAARGLSLLFATGDYGVTDQGSCPKNRFQGQWPAASPWVTGVGGTEGGNVDTPEHAWGGSAGGFSDRWGRPEYQVDAVSGYFKTVDPSKLPEKKYFNTTGAGFPDVAAQGNDFLVVSNGGVIPVAGTSCSCPTFSGVVSLLNDIRLAAGKSTLGFLNPLFYKNAGAFMDITTGSNQAGTGCGPMGFSASAGWDPVTGLGTPHYERLAKVVRALP